MTTGGEARENAAGPARWVPAFVAVSAAWGTGFALIKIAVDAGVAPLWVAYWRCLLGALTLWLLCGAAGAAPLRDLRTWSHVAVVGLLLHAAPFTLFAYGETQVSSVTAGVWNALTPLATLVFVILLLADEHPTARRIGGVALGLVGVLVVLEVWRGVAGGQLLGNLACVAATTCYGAAFAYTQRFLAGRRESAVSLAAAQVTCAVVELTLVAPMVSGAPTWPGWPAVVALTVLGAVGTGIAYMLNLRVIRIAGSTVASTVAYLTPLWSTAAGVVFLDEPVSWTVAVGGALIVLGIVLTRSKGARGSVAAGGTRGTSWPPSPSR